MISKAHPHPMMISSTGRGCRLQPNDTADPFEELVTLAATTHLRPRNILPILDEARVLTAYDLVATPTSKTADEKTSRST